MTPCMSIREAYMWYASQSRGVAFRRGRRSREERREEGVERDAGRHIVRGARSRNRKRRITDRSAAPAIRAGKAEANGMPTQTGQPVRGVVAVRKCFQIQGFL